MANNIDINKLVGDVAALNKQITETSALLSQLITKQGTLNKELGGAKGLKQSQDALNKSKNNGNEIEKVGNSLLAQRNKAVVSQDRALRVLTKDTIKQKEALSQLTKEIKAEDDAYKKLDLQHKKSLANAKKLAAQYGVNSKQAKIAAADANKYGNQLKKIDASLGQQQRKVGGYFKDIVKGGVAMAASFLSVQAVLKVLKSLFTTVFLGTQDNIDFFNQKLENVKGQFAVITDAVSNFGQTIIESFNNAEESTTKFGKASSKIGDVLSNTNPIVLAYRYNIEALKKLFPETAEAMKKNGEDAERLQVMMDALNEKEIEYIGTKANLQKEMRLARLDAKKAGDDDAEALMFIDKAITAEKSLMALEMEFAVERSRIATERLDLSISTRQDRKDAALLAAKVIELEVASIKKLTTLETERLSLSRRLARQTGETETEIVDGLDKINSKTIENVGEVKDANKELTVTYEETADRKKEIDTEVADWDIKEAERAAEKKKIILQATKDFTQDAVNAIFDISQVKRDNELSAIEEDYAKKIEAAEGNSALQSQLENDLANERKRIAREQAVAERNRALFNIAMSTGEGIARAVAFSPATFGLPFSAFVATMGALQTTAVLSKDLPGFFTGTESAPEGLAWVAEKGRELIESNGQFSLAENKQVTNLNKGDKVYNNRDTEQMLNAAIYKDIAVNGNEGMETRLDSLIHAFKNQPREVTTFDDEGIQRFLKTGNNSITRDLNKARK